MKQKHFIDSHKGVTFLIILLLMAYHNQWDNPTAWVYLSLHGSYGIIWNLKSRIFPDKSWEQPTGIGFGLVIWAALTLYWIAPWLLMSRNVQLQPWTMSIAIVLYCFGLFLHFTSDMQKFTYLELRPETLITDKMMSISRNVNYFGELLIYSSFAVLANHWLPFAVILLFIIAYWGPNMVRKDQSLSRYPEFEAYKRKTKWFIPYIY